MKGTNKAVEEIMEKIGVTTLTINISDIQRDFRRAIALALKSQECCICGKLAECNEVSIGGGVHFKCCSRKCLIGLFDYENKLREEGRREKKTTKEKG